MHLPGQPRAHCIAQTADMQLPAPKENARNRMAPGILSFHHGAGPGRRGGITPAPHDLT